MINEAYEDITHWRRNLFKVPSGKAGKAFVTEIARLLRAYAEAGALEAIALKSAMVLPALLLQKPSASSKAKDHIQCLDRRLKLWREGDINSLVQEGRAIQSRFLRNMQKSQAQTALTFAKLMMEGKVKAALHHVSNQSRGGILHMDSQVDLDGSDTVREILKKKHPPGKPIVPSAIIPPEVPVKEHHPVIFEDLNGSLIRSIALRTSGAAGPSGMDSSAWRRMCSSFHNACSELCTAMASVGKRICTSYVDPMGLRAFVASRLIALDKCPGVRPIGIGEVARRIIGKAILAIIADDIQEAAGFQQVCAGQQAGCEAAVHAMHEIFDDPTTQGILLETQPTRLTINLNRQVALHNIQLRCPSLAMVLINTYRMKADLFINGETIPSEEGTTQGNPLAMAMYAIAILPLIQRVKCEVKQAWYADNATAGGRVDQLRSWWDKVLKIGPEYGYLANPTKTWLIVKEEYLSAAAEAFHNTGVQITSQGKRYLGAALGTASFVEAYVGLQVEKWVLEIERLASIASSQPHAAYTAFTHGLAASWNYVSRTIPDIGDLLDPVEKAIRHKLLPALTGRSAVSDLERELFSLPVHLGGLNIANPSKNAARQHNASTQISAPLTALIIHQSSSYSQSMKIEQQREKQQIKNDQRKERENQAATLYRQLPEQMQRAMDCASEKGASSWLSTLPIAEHGFALHKGAFRDALCLRYGWHPGYLPTECVCGKQFTVDHALSCPCGGLPSLRHNEIRDVTADLLNEVCHNVSTEPELQPLSGELLSHRTANTENGARLDVKAQGFWGDRRQYAFFDVRVFNPLAPSNRRLPLPQCFRSHEKEKRRAYDQRVREVEHGSFTPLVFTAMGGMGKAAKVAYGRIAALIAAKRDQPYSQVIGWMRCMLSFSLLRSAIMCLRGARFPFHNRPASAEIELATSEGMIPH